LKRTEKEELVGTLSDIFRKAQVGLLVDYRGLNVAEITDLRRQLHESATTLRILKNRIARLAIRESPFAPLENELSEPRALIYGEDAVAPAKVLTKYLTGSEKLKFIAGVLVTPTGRALLDANRMKALGTLPSREELLARLLFVMKGTHTRFVRTLNEIPARFVRTLAAVAASKGEA
jgi:large subunit ribosomal protein L10